MVRALLCHSDPNPTEVSCILSTIALASLPSFAVRRLLHLQWQRERQGLSGAEGSILLLFPFLSIPLGSHSTASFLTQDPERRVWDVHLPINHSYEKSHEALGWLWPLLCMWEVWDSLHIPGCSVCSLRNVRAGNSGPGALRKLLLG